MDKEEVQKYIPVILEKLKSVNPKIIIIFGSYSRNTLTEDSDLDLLIVLDKNKVPSSYDEKIKMKLEVRRAIRDINKKIPIDLLVYTIPEYEVLMRSGSSFSKELELSGKIIYEKAG